MKKIKDLQMSETSFEDGSKWLTITFEDDTYTHELLNESENGNLDIINMNSDKILLESVSKDLAELVEGCRSSDSDMFFVEQDEISEEKIYKLQEEVDKLKLNEVIEFGEETAITVYGSIITEFIFPPFRKTI